ncbi:MAG: hypothetical protein GY828_06700 [Candidatus Gracilibacteria bacterium]|nr:hypothetical protein [Candidatus Gracilibacteria bacterium]
MTELKTQKTEKNIIKFLECITDDTKKKDCYTLLNMMKEISKDELYPKF